MVDSQAAILALKNIDTTSELVKQTKNALNAIGQDYKIAIKWIKAHVNNKGNEIADRVAKTGSMIEPNTEIKCGKAYVKDLITKDMYASWDRRWQTRGDCRQAFFFYKFVDRSKSKKIIKLNRYELGLLIRYTTGHVNLTRHNKITGSEVPRALTRPEPRYNMQDPEDVVLTDDEEIRYRLCNLKGKEETPMHMVSECLPLWRKRWEHLGHYDLEG